MKRWVFWTAVAHTARLSTAIQILIFLPLTLATLQTQAFLLLSLLLSVHALIHGTLSLYWPMPSWTILQVPMHPFLILLVFNTFSSSINPWILTAANVWGATLQYAAPLFVILEGTSSLLVSQSLGQRGKRLLDEGESFQFPLLISSSIAYVISAWSIVFSYPDAASSPLTATLFGAAITAITFLTIIGFSKRTTNIMESSSLSVFIALQIYLCCDTPSTAPSSISSYGPMSDIIPHLETLLNFMINTLPKPILISLLYRLSILQVASSIIPLIGSDGWTSEEDEAQTPRLAHILLTYRQFIFVAVFSQMILLDHSSQVWWRWINIFFTLSMWGVELSLSDGIDSNMKMD